MNDLILKYFTVEAMVKIANQIKAAPSFVFDKFFNKNKIGVLGSSISVPIKKGAGIVLESVSPNAEHLIQEESEKFIVTINLPRFPLISNITANELNTIKSLENTNEQLETLVEKTTDILSEHKNSFLTTIEHMCVGALFGKVTDGMGNVLFEFSSSAPKQEFKGKTIINSLNSIDDALTGELGTIPPYDILASRTFIDRLATKATSEDLFKQNQAGWEEVDGIRSLVIYGKKFIPYSATYKNGKKQPIKFIPDGEAIVTPLSAEVYSFYYGRADHTEAVGKKPTLFFAAKPEELPLGRGYAITSETKSIPVCIRPAALIKLIFSA